MQVIGLLSESYYGTTSKSPSAKKPEAYLEKLLCSSATGWELENTKILSNRDQDKTKMKDYKSKIAIQENSPVLSWLNWKILYVYKSNLYSKQKCWHCCSEQLRVKKH